MWSVQTRLIAYFVIFVLLLVNSSNLIAAEQQVNNQSASADAVWDEGYFSAAPATSLVDDQTDEPVGDSMQPWSKVTELWSSWSVQGYLKNETAYRFIEPRSITKIRNILSLQARKPLSDRMTLHAAGWAYYDHAYDLFDYQTISARSVRDEQQPLVFIEDLNQQKDSEVIDLREFYFELSTNSMDVWVGKQYIIWGVLEGIRVVDEINPQDFRELIMPDLLDYRIPLWSFRADIYAGSTTWEMIWIPDLRFHKPAPQGSEWEMLQEVTNTTYPDGSDPRNSEFGLRMQTGFLGGDIALSYFFTWDDFPVIFRKAIMDGVSEPHFYPTFTRINMYGLTYQRPVSIGILKFEGVYVPDKYFGMPNDTDRDNDGWLDNDGVLKKKHYRWALGYEFNYKGMDVVPAVTQWVIQDYEQALIQDQYDTSLTLFLRKPLRKNSAVFELLVIRLLNMEETYMKPQIMFNLTDRFQVTLGGVFFDGAKSSLGVSASGGAVSNLTDIEQRAQFFGNFYNNDQVFTEFKYSF